MSPTVGLSCDSGRRGGLGLFLELGGKVRFDDHCAETAGRYHPPQHSWLFWQACHSLSLSHKNKCIIRNLFLLSALDTWGCSVGHQADPLSCPH